MVNLDEFHRQYSLVSARRPDHVIQCFKFAGFVLWPFGRQVDVGHFGFGGLLGNIIWILLLGWELCIIHLTLGLIFCITIIGIPFGIQHFKLAMLAIVPFGARITG